MRKGRYSIALLALALALVGCANTPTPSGPSEADLTPVQAAAGVIAEGNIVPREWASASFTTGGQIVEVLVSEGQEVQAGELLVRLNSAQQQAAQAEAEAALAMAQAELAALRRGPTEEEIATAAAAVDTARTRVQEAQGALAGARANLARVQAGVTAEEIAISEREIEAARNALYAAQGQRDAICGQAHTSTTARANCEGAEGSVQQAEERVLIAELSLQRMRSGATPEEVSAAEANVQQAYGGVAGAQAGVAQAEAALAQVQRGVTEERISAAEAGVAQAEAALARARALMEDTELLAPIAGTVVMVQAKVGELAAAGTPVVTVADLSGWEVETADLSELEVVKVMLGQRVTIVPDALPELELAGTVTQIDDRFGERSGDVTYMVHVALEESDPRLRWGMTVEVRFSDQGPGTIASPAPATATASPSPTAAPAATATVAPEEPTLEPTTPAPAATPTPNEVVHVVRNGEHLTGIASRYGSTVSAIMQRNGLRSANLIFVGQELIVPLEPGE